MRTIKKKKTGTTLIRQHREVQKKERWPTLLLSLRLTFLVAGWLRVSLYVAFQVTAELWGGGKEGQADGHQLPACCQTSGAGVACGLPHQLHVQFVPQPRHVPALGNDKQGAVTAVETWGPVSHVSLDELEHLAGLLPDSAIAGDEHGLFDGPAVPRQHVGDGDPAPEESLCVHVEMLAGPVLHANVRRWGLPQGGVGELVGRPSYSSTRTITSFCVVVVGGAVGAQGSSPSIHHAFLSALQLSLQL